MRYKKNLVILAIVILVLAIYGWKTNIIDNTDVKKVIVSKAKKEKLKVSLTVDGYFEHDDITVISSRIQGVIKEVLVDVGDKVDEQQVLAIFDKEDLQVQLQKAEGLLLSSKANLSEEFSQLKAQLPQAQVAFENTKTNYDRMSQLFAEGAVTKVELEESKLSFVSAESKLVIIKDKLLKIEKKGTDKGEISPLEGKVKEAEATYNIAQLNLFHSEVKSTKKGVILENNIKEGMAVTNGYTLFKIGATNDLVFRAEVDEKYLWALEMGQPVRIIGDGFRNKSVTGTVTKIFPVPVDMPIKSKDVKYVVEVYVEDTGRINPGMSGELSLDVEVESAIVVPEDAIIQRDDDDIVFVIENGIAREKSVKTGVKKGELVEILSGLKEGDQVILSPENDLEDETKVKV